MKKLMALIAGLALTAQASADVFSNQKSFRAGKTEASFLLNNQNPSTININNGAYFDMDDDWGMGFVIGHNISEKINLSGQFDWVNIRYIADGPENQDEAIRHKADIWNFQFNGTYHLFPGRFTPYLSAGFGWTNIDSNIIDGVYQGCSPGYYWYWWCGTYYSTANETTFQGNAALGLRFEIDRSMFVRASYQERWLDMSYTKGTPTIGSWNFEIGSMF